MADWDAFSGQYDDIFNADQVYSGMLRLLGESIADAGGARVLDLGCGTGNATAAVLEALPGSSILAVDPSGGMRRICSERFSDEARVEVVEGTATGIPSADGEFDLVVSNLALHHVPIEEKEAAAAEIARVTATGGTLLYLDVFCDVEGGPGDPEWYRDNIDKAVAWALCSCESGAFRHMIVLLKTMVSVLERDGEYLVTPRHWLSLLSDAGFAQVHTITVEPARCGLKMLRAVRS